MGSTAIVLELIDVNKTFESVDSAGPVQILQGINLALTEGESLSIIGPSGSGKSTLLNIMGTLDQPSAGMVRLKGMDLRGFDEVRLAEVRNRTIGFIFQAHHLLPHCTVLENVLVPTLASGTKGERIQAVERAKHLLQRVGLDTRPNHRPGQLSGGEQQRVAVVRALINKPSLLLADEPTGALDRTAAGEMAKLLVELNREEKVTLVVVTHSLELARQMGRVIELQGGKLVEAK